MIHGVGYLDYNGRDLVAAKLQNKILARENGIKTNTYKAWEHMLGRCYNDKVQEKAKTYINCTVDKKWHNFQNFAKWFNMYYKPGYQLDKDLLIKGNKIYSENTCCLIPPEINKALETLKSKRNPNIPLGVRIIINKNTGAKTIYGQYRREYLGTFNSIENAWNAYKIAKENHLKLLAEKYKDVIEENVYQALLNYKVEITD